MDKSIKKIIIGYCVCRNLIFALLLQIAYFVGSAVFHEQIAPYIKYINVAYYIITALSIYFCFIHVLIRNYTWNYMIDDKCIEYKRGLLFKKRTVLPHIRVQQIATSTNPVLHKLGLVKVSILTTTREHSLRFMTIEEGQKVTVLVTDLLHKKMTVNKEVADGN